MLIFWTPFLVECCGQESGQDLGVLDIVRNVKGETTKMLQDHPLFSFCGSGCGLGALQGKRCEEI